MLHPSTTSATSATSNNNGTAHPANATQVLLGNNNTLRLGIPVGKRVHTPRTLSATVSTSALKFAHTTANCQKPKVTTASASPLDIVPR